MTECNGKYSLLILVEVSKCAIIFYLNISTVEIMKTYIRLKGGTIDKIDLPSN